MNFFHQIPEYYRIGQTELFVAYELQIGLTSEINSHRENHDSYERDRILPSQPLLKNYDERTVERGMVNTTTSSSSSVSVSSCSGEDNKLIENILLGRIGSEVLVPSPCTGNDDDDDNNTVLFESGPLSLSDVQRNDDSHTLSSPTRLCINNRNLNWCASNDETKILKKTALIVAGPYDLKETKRYFVESFIFSDVIGTGIKIGLYAHVGPYCSQITCSAVNKRRGGGNGNDDNDDDDLILVESGHNYVSLERACPIPIGTTGIEVIAYGYLDNKSFSFRHMELSLKEYDIYHEK